MMKQATAPRRLYVRKSTALVCFDGKFFAPVAKETQVDLEGEVTVEPTEADPRSKRRQVIVSQRQGRKVVKETWRTAKVA